MSDESSPNDDRLGLGAVQLEHLGHDRSAVFSRCRGYPYERHGTSSRTRRTKGTRGGDVLCGPAVHPVGLYCADTDAEAREGELGFSG